jgi:phage-related protein
VFIDNEDANKKMQDTDKKGKGIAETLGSGIKTAAKWGTAIVAGAGAAASGLFALTTKTAEYADEIDKLSERTGINREELQRWKYAAGQSGADVGKLEVGIKTLSGIMDDAINGNAKATEAFTALGISIDDLKNKTQEDIFSAVMDGLADMEQGAQRNAIGADLMGKSYTELLPLLNAGSEGMNDLKNRADELGIVMSEDAVKANVTFGDTLEDIKASFGGVTRGLTESFLPIMQKIADYIVDNMPMIQSMISGVFQGLGKAVEAVLPLLMSLFEKVLPPLMDLFEVLVDVILPPVIEVFGELAKLVLPLVIEIFEALMPIIEPILKALAAIIKAVVSAIQGDWEGAWEGIKEFFSNIWDAIKRVAEGLSNIFGPIFKKLGDLITGIWDGIVGGIKSAINWILEGINEFIRGINKIKIPDWVPLVGGKGFSINEIPLLADGGIVRESGRVIVGEYGPEILDLPKGAKVTPLGNQEANIYVQLDGKTIAEAVGAPLAKTIRVKTGLAY